ncbi:MAG: type 3 dihydrofolate reductase, partial [Sandaracinaceae bacterium]|nr:type 3 dihydrofolate reductase [Sandaracinaceae bacterium]
MRIALIAAVARNGVIGRGGALPWRLPDELAWFKERTLGKPVIMGRRTWESLRGALPGRLNVVVTRNETYVAQGALVVASLDDALARCGGAEEAVVIGGRDLYEAALPRADRLYLTHVEAEVDGDTHFPEVDLSEWIALESRAHAADERHAFAF